MVALDTVLLYDRTECPEKWGSIVPIIVQGVEFVLVKNFRVFWFFLLILL